MIKTFVLSLGAIVSIAAAVPSAPCVPENGCVEVTAVLPASPGPGGGTYATPGNSTGQAAHAPRVWDEDGTYDDYMGDASWDSGPPLSVKGTFCDDNGDIVLDGGSSGYSNDDSDDCLEVYVMVPWWIYETYLINETTWAYGWVLHWSKKGPIDLCYC